MFRLSSLQNAAPSAVLGSAHAIRAGAHAIRTGEHFNRFAELISSGSSGYLTSVKAILLMDALLDTIDKPSKTNKNFKDAFSNRCYIDLIDDVQNTALAITALICIESLLKA